MSAQKSDRRSTTLKRARSSDVTPAIGLAVLLFVFLTIGVVSYRNTRSLNAGARSVVATHDVILALNNVLALSSEAESGVRGFVLTGDERYLDSFNTNWSRIDQRIGDFAERTEGDVEQQALIPEVRNRLAAKRQVLEETVTLRRQQGFDAAQRFVASDRGRDAMLAIENLVETMSANARRLRQRRLDEMESAFQGAVAGGILTGAIGIIISGVLAALLYRTARSRQREEWLQAGRIGLSAVIVGDAHLETLADRILKFSAEHLGAQAGAFFGMESGRLRRIATYGVPTTGGVPEWVETNDGLLGRAVTDKRSFVLNDVPDGYLTVGSALGQAKPRNLVITAPVSDDVVQAVIELGFVQPIREPVIEFLDRVGESVAMAVRSANDRRALQNLLEETQRQGEELQVQGEELRVSNEELEEQSRVLTESQSRLEMQQAELEQTNVQLEAQTELLESQRDEVMRSKAALEAQTEELERASRYKSDFLANMSHELRTPLNSSLILSKLLADNPHGNLSPEQVQFAETIQSAGNDLLVLINDILDLSKIESGHLEIRPESIHLQDLLDDLNRTFAPVADEKQLTFQVSVLPATPDLFSSDRQRLTQVLKNLLSNAFKFTEEGGVVLTVGPTNNGLLSFAVTDTGIGIPANQQSIVFEAFRQADGTTNRKYGGTGLGLSISRELTRLLGGDLHLASAVGRGSTFTVTIPATYDATIVRARTHEPTPQPVVMAPRITPKRAVAGDAPKAAPPIADDREKLSGTRHVLLVVEDDVSFARILYDLAHELDFECLIASTAEDAVVIALQRQPSAVVLDIGLPDHSGLSVLDRLKHDSRTRHIPIHVVSAGDHAASALALGAVGYMPKPVKREELIDALKRIETRLVQRMRRVLVVEDDAVQRESLQKFLGSYAVETVGAGSAAECLELLRTSTFDCMVLDLTLPDTSGYTLLETLSQEDAYSFPPVIVYTGRELSPDEEQRLRRYSKSIIIKGAKSPERLLDEVTLFLHQVVSSLPPEQQRLLEKAQSRDSAIERRRILVVEDDVRNVFAITSILEPRGAIVQIARNGQEALTALEKSLEHPDRKIDLVLMDVMMPVMDGLQATREIRKRAELKKLPIIMLTAKAMKDDQEQCVAAGANDYMAKPLDVDRLLSLVRVWMPR